MINFIYRNGQVTIWKDISFGTANMKTTQTPGREKKDFLAQDPFAFPRLFSICLSTAKPPRPGFQNKEPYKVSLIHPDRLIPQRREYLRFEQFVLAF
jgi:hypothetical protein